MDNRVAEEETEALSAYFVETDHWDRLFRGDIDVIYGAKGSGKSALYSLLLSRSGELFDRSVLLVAAENPRGAPAFRDLLLDPPASEREFVSLWKLYFASLLHSLLVEYEIKCDATTQLQQALEREGLIKGSLSLSGLLSGVLSYVRRALRPQALEGGVEFDPASQLPKGFTGKIIFSEPTKDDDPELRSVDRLLEYANTALASTRLKTWILLDRLDVAFSENEELEVNALRALFRVYLDIFAYSNIQLKIFLRTDIWARITAGGFREASHVTRHLTIAWNKNSLLNLIVRRALHNEHIRRAYQVSEDLGSSTAEDQESFFYRVFPGQVDIGPNKPATHDWMLSRTRDGSRVNAPRELIHFLNSLRDVQVRRFELGVQPVPEENNLFARVAFKEALPEVSRVRLEQTLYAEHADQKGWIERLRGEKTLQTPDSLAQIWGLSIAETIQRADMLSSTGFFEQRGTRQSIEYWVPFLYRDALDLIQGSAE